MKHDLTDVRINIANASEFEEEPTLVQCDVCGAPEGELCSGVSPGGIHVRRLLRFRTKSLNSLAVADGIAWDGDGERLFLSPLLRFQGSHCENPGEVMIVGPDWAQSHCQEHPSPRCSLYAMVDAFTGVLTRVFYPSQTVDRSTLRLRRFLSAEEQATVEETILALRTAPQPCTKKV
jgi:hypothetical protein